MKLNLISNRFSLAVAAGLAMSTISSRAQSVVATGTLTDVPGAGNVFDYTLTLKNTGTEAISSFWLGWIPGSFNILNPTIVANSAGWSSVLDGNSIQYGPGTAIAAGASATFTFDSTSTPAQFAAGTAGKSTAYGVDDPNQLSLSLDPPNTETFALQVVPEPSTFSLLAIGALGFATTLRRKICSP